MIRLRDLSASAVALEWHEAVAVVAALTAAVWEARASHAPTLDAAVLTGEGDVRLAGEERLPGAVTSGLALALGSLLETTPCPAELRHIVTANLGPDPELDSVQAFAGALMFFERPAREDVLRQLAARAEAALEQARASDELERLTERARQRAEETIPAKPRETTASMVVGSARRLVAPVAVALTVFLAVALAAATLFTTAQAPERRDSMKAGPVEDDELTPPAATGAPTSAGGASAPEATTTPATAASEPVAASGAAPASSTLRSERTGAVARDRAGVGPTAPTPSIRDGGAAARPEREVVVRVTELGGAPLPPVASVSAAAAARSVGARIYTAADSGVTPPILVKPHLPAEPPSDVPPWEVGTLELTVNAAGTVDQVHLISPYNRYQERMLVAAAKAWLFQPAIRDGRPVRFRTRIRVTL
jgi:hypothetical protein